jgi:dTDP-4-amino-4,6-dideoxygalactose transaminase
MLRNLFRRLPSERPTAIRFHKHPWSPADEDLYALAPKEAEAWRRTFESFLRAYLDLNKDTTVSLVGSGRTALRLGLAALTRIETRRKFVIAPTYCCEAIIDPIVSNGLIPRFVDIGPDLLPHPEQYLRAITGDAVCLLLVNLCGKRLADNERERVAAACRKSGVYLIEDNCHYFQATSHFMPADMEFYSFGFSKVLRATAGGALISRVGQAEAADELSTYTEQPNSSAETRFRYYRERFDSGEPSKELEAEFRQARCEFGRVLMSDFDLGLVTRYAPAVPTVVKQQIENGRRLHRELARYPHCYATQGVDDHLFTRLSVILQSRDLFCRFWTFMTERRIELEGMYKPLHLDQTASKGVKAPIAEDLYPRVYNIPNRSNLSRTQLATIREALASFARDVS